MTMKLILASSSPRRAELLRDVGIAFAVCAPQVEEARRPGESVETMVARLAEAKARAAAELVKKDNSAIIIGADTAVELDGELFGKPFDAAHARKILAALSGHTHHVLTGICVLRLPDGATRSAVETTAVTFAALDGNEIEAYVASGEPFDKAGGYAIQGRAGRYIPRIEGCYFNVVGLPLARLHALLRDLGWRDDRRA
jgi:nucleoside triphosphate pyrophosphatase